MLCATDARILALALCCSALAACSGHPLTCGPGTRESGGECVAIPGESDAGLGLTCGPGTHEESGHCVPLPADGGIVCGPGTELVGGSCVPLPGDAGVTCGPGTHQEGSSCVPDSVPVDTLLPPKAEIVLFRTGLYCISNLDVLHPDGTLETVAVTAASSASATLAVPATAGDCDGGAVGLIALAAGRTVATFGAELNGKTLTTRASLLVKELGTITLSLSFYVDSNPVGVGGDGSLMMSRSITDSAGSNLNGLECGLVPRYVHVRSDNEAVAVAFHDPTQQYWDWKVQGVAVGTANLTGTYEPPGQTFSSNPAQVQVVDGGTLVGLRRIDLYDDAGLPQSFSWGATPPICTRPKLIGTYRTAASVTYFAEVKTGVTWTSRTTVLVEQGGAGHYCSAGEGDAWLVASAAGFELGRSFTVYPTGRITSIAATSLSSNPVVPQVIGSQSLLCPAERFSAKFADATEKDVTTSPAADWSLGPANGAPMYFRARDADGTPIQDLAGNPCFANAYLVTQPATFNGTFWYAGQPATFSFQFQPQ